MKTGQTTQIERTWESIEKMVDEMVRVETIGEVSDKYGGALNTNNPEDEGKKVHVIDPKSQEQVDKLERKTLDLIEDIISLMYFGKDLRSKEDKSESSFLAKLSTRLHRKVTLELEAPMAVGMYENDRNVYLLVNPIRLRYTVSTVAEVIAIVRHELYHILYQHLPETKQYSNDPTTQYILNIAQDCEINQANMIKNDLPKGTITLDYVREKANNPELEEHAGYVVYYKALIESEEFMEEVKQKQEQKQMKVFNVGGDGSGSGDDSGNDTGDESETGDATGNGGQGSTVDLDDIVGENAHSTWGGDEVSQDTAEKAMGGIVKETYNSLSDKERGLLSSRIKGQISKLTHDPEVNWRDQIKRQHGRMKSRLKRKTISRPNRRMPNRLDLKGKLPDYKINIVMALDVSGSVSDNALAYTMGEGYHLSRELNAPLTMLQIDSELASVQTIERATDFDRVNINARGGTRFQPAFDYLAENGLTDKDTMLVYVTDGYGEPEQHLQRHGFNNVLWILVDTNNKDVLSCDGKGRVELLNNDRSYGG